MFKIILIRQLLFILTFFIALFGVLGIENSVAAQGETIYGCSEAALNQPEGSNDCSADMPLSLTEAQPFVVLDMIALECEPPVLPGGTMGDCSGSDCVSGQQDDRIFRDGSPSQCSPAKPFPGNYGSGGGYVNVYHFGNPTGRERCVTVTVHAGDCYDAPFQLHASAFTGYYDPTEPTFGEQPGNGVYYIGDAGSSDETQTFSFVIPAGIKGWSLVLQNNYGINACNYSAIAISSAPPCDAPIPTLGKTGLVALALIFFVTSIWTIRRKRNCEL